MAAAWLLLLFADYHWMGTLMAFGPRWVLLAPVGMAAACAAFWRPRALMLLAVAGAIVAGPVMGLCVPWRTWGQFYAVGPKLRVLTCNTLVGRANTRLAAMIEIEQPDLVALQEWPASQPLPASLSDGWHVVCDQGLVVASRLPIVASETIQSPVSPSQTLGVRCELLTADRPVHFCVLHLRTPRKGLEAVLRRWWGGLADLEEVTIQRQLDGEAVGTWLNRCRGPIIVSGDLNLTTDSAVYRRRFGHLKNAFSTAGWGWGSTKFTRFHSVRIDHILANPDWRFVDCRVGPDVGSDHRPLIADLELFRSRPSPEARRRQDARPTVITRGLLSW